MTVKEFTEISPAGVILEFIIDPDKDSIAFGFRGGPKGQFVAMHGLRASLRFGVIGYLQLGGIDRREPPPDFEFPLFMYSDMEGMFGRKCPMCKSYFRMTSVSEYLYCPYCGTQDELKTFLTDNQRLYVKKILETVRAAIEKRETLELDLDAVIDKLPENRPPWVYIEEKQQNTYKCNHCQCSFDVLGEYGTCPNCGEMNALELFVSKMDVIRAQTAERVSVGEFLDNDISGSKLSQLISTFESMANFLKKRLNFIPMTPKRRKDFEKLSFQRFKESSESLRNWFGIDICKSLHGEDVQFIHVMFHRRHLITHNNGQVDEKYLRETADKTVRLNQQIRVVMGDIERLHTLLRKCGINLISDFLSLQ